MSSNKKVVEQILLIVEQSNDELDLVEAVIEWCEKNNIDPEFAGNILKKNKAFKKKIKVHASKRNLLKPE